VQGLPLQPLFELHPPLPAQEFLPFVASQPPWFLQEFLPAQQCFATVVFESSVKLFPGFGDAEAAAVVPITKPANAAPTSTLRIDFVISSSSPLVG
jgi:hypothetical protein